jgi:hypothetical protein
MDLAAASDIDRKAREGSRSGKMSESINGSSYAAPDTPKPWRRRLRCMVTSTLDVGVPSSGRRVACDRSRFAIISELRSRHAVKPLI